MSLFNNKKNKLSFYIFIVGILCLLIGTSYAFFSADLLGIKENTIQIGNNLVFNYQEKSNNISLSGQDILTDEQGMVSNKYFDFDVSLTSDETTANYYIYLTADSTSNINDGSFIKVYLTDQNNNRIVNTESIRNLQRHETYENSYYLYGKSITSNNNIKTTDSYRLRIWIDATNLSTSVTENNGIHELKQQNISYKFKINVATGAIPPINYMVKGSTSNYRSSTYKTKIKTISFVNYIDQEEIDNALISWDLSQAKDRSIMGWVDSEYNLYIGSNKTIYAPVEFSAAFSGMTALTTIDFTNLDTSYVTNMASMFYDCSGLTTLDVSNFDTSSVTNMAYMFYNCSKLKTLDLRNFDTSKVTSWSSMFNKCSKLTTLIVKNDDERTRINTNTSFAIEKIKTVDEL